MFRVDGVLFPSRRTLREQRRNKELGKEIESVLEIVSLDSKEVVRLLRGSVGIVEPPVCLQETRIFVLVGVFLGPQEKHVFAEVCQSLNLRGIAERADGNVHCGRGQIRLGIGYE